jgi:hypothetical protein
MSNHAAIGRETPVRGASEVLGVLQSHSQTVEQLSRQPDNEQLSRQPDNTGTQGIINNI